MPDAAVAGEGVDRDEEASSGEDPVSAGAVSSGGEGSGGGGPGSALGLVVAVLVIGGLGAAAWWRSRARSTAAEAPADAPADVPAKAPVEGFLHEGP